MHRVKLIDRVLITVKRNIFVIRLPETQIFPKIKKCRNGNEADNISLGNRRKSAGKSSRHRIRIRHSCVHVLINTRMTVRQRKRSKEISRQEQQCPRTYNVKYIWYSDTVLRTLLGRDIFSFTISRILYANKRRDCLSIG